MKSNRFFLILLFGVLLLSCYPQVDDDTYWDTPTKGDMDLSIYEIHLDTVPLNLENTSGVGSWLLYKDALIFVDELYSTLHFLDDQLQLSGSSFGRGDGPGELPRRIVGFAVRGERMLVLGPSYDYYLLDIVSGQVLQKGLILFDDQERNIDELLRNPHPEYKEIYEVDYPGLQMAILNDHEVVFNITSSHPLFNPYSHREYYRSGRVLAVLDIRSGKLSGIYGRMSPVYQSWRFLPYLTSVKIGGAGKKGYFLGYEADPMIYYYSAPDKLQYAFGNAGKGMKTDYEQVDGIEDYVQNYKEIRPKYGFYTSLKYLPEVDLLFRGYRKGSSEKMDGLQIYKGTDLIGDVDVPKGFSVLGVRNNEYFGEIQSGKGMEAEDIPVLVRIKW